jgi:hypothetical protein
MIFAKSGSIVDIARRFSYQAKIFLDGLFAKGNT